MAVFPTITRRSHLIKLFLLLIMTVLCMVFYVIPPLRQRAIRVAEKMDLVREKWHSEPLQNVTVGYKTILIYTSYFGQVPWSIIKGKEKRFTGLNGKKCKVSSCYISYHRKDYIKSDAVVFHSSNMPALSRMQYLLWRKPKSQKWIWYSLENPVKTKIYSYAVESINKMFELTMTYRKDSSVFAPYGYYKMIQAETESGKNNERFIQNVQSITAKKDRLILWQVSNCDARLRIKVAQAIDRYIHVDVFGSCQRYFNHSGGCKRWTSSCNSISERYKFYLAFENYNCKDYITEKYWNNALARNIVPIVVAGSYNKQLLIPGSYIDILDFPNAKSLADYLNYLDVNKTAYEEYFHWKKNYTYHTETTLWLCDLCEAVHGNTSRERLDLVEFWGTPTCHDDDWYIEHIWLKSASKRTSLGYCWMVIFVVMYIILI